jgi:hypothetical protein
MMFIPRPKFSGKVRGIWERGEGKYRCAFYVVPENGSYTGGCVISMRWVCGAQGNGVSTTYGKLNGHHEDSLRQN